MATTVVYPANADVLSLGGRPASHDLRATTDTTRRLVAHVLSTSECRDLTDDAGRKVVTDIAERCVALAADVLDCGLQPTDSELARLRHAAAEWARMGVPLAPIQHAFHEGFSVGLRVVADRAVVGEHAALVDGAVLMFGLLDVVSEAVSSAYLDVYRSIASQRHDQAHAMVTALLAGDAHAARIAEGIGVEPATGYDVVALHFPVRVDVQRIWTELTDFVTPGPPLAILSSSGGTVLLPDATPTAVEELVAAFSVIADTPISAAAVLASPERVPDAAETAYELLRLAQRLNYRPDVYRIADLALEFQIARPGVGQRHLQRILDPLRRIPDLLPTLEAFVSTEANRKKAAKQLVVHPNTVDYRLKRIEQITGIDPMKSSGLRSLHAALIADHLNPKKSA